MGIWETKRMHSAEGSLLVTGGEEGGGGVRGVKAGYCLSGYKTARARPLAAEWPSGFLFCRWPLPSPKNNRSIKRINCARLASNDSNLLFGGALMWKRFGAKIPLFAAQ
ncbi:hypothetical protein CDAR_496931 [Caerostris darwini]|uniref:Uncharacterized protein n=1 Tax=Caerostris darwini TaxID=1538125 RepID=A0AAV4U5A0_9ARAC|nr:hypothetical protein CDAR_496931 [Caerostris darwini]